MDALNTEGPFRLGADTFCFSSPGLRFIALQSDIEALSRMLRQSDDIGLTDQFYLRRRYTVATEIFNALAISSGFWP